MMLEMWRSILAPFIQDREQLQRSSLNVQRICYGFVSQSLLMEPEFDAWPILEQDILFSLATLGG